VTRHGTQPFGARKRKSRSIIIKIPVTIGTLTAAMLLVQELVALARAVKLPMQTMKEGEK
jgi:hypothetical protein